MDKRKSSPNRRKPAKSPSRPVSDRFIPLRPNEDITLDWSPKSSHKESRKSTQGNATSEDLGKQTYQILIHNELLGSSIDHFKDDRVSAPLTGSSSSASDPSQSTETDETKTNSQNIPYLQETPVLQFSSPPRTKASPIQSPGLSLSPLSHSSAKLLSSPCGTPRKICKVPFKVLDAPDLADDFYLNLLDWSHKNVVAVGLGSCVYMWSAQTGQVTKLCEYRPSERISSIRWSKTDDTVGIGTSRGNVDIWNATTCQKTHSYTHHTGFRVATLAWNHHILASGSRDQMVAEVDSRVDGAPIRQLRGHRQEVCGLAYSPDSQYLASGGNDNSILLWSASSTKAVHTLQEHHAAVKALAWSPHHHGVLASGGGTADQTIRFWNTSLGQCSHFVNARSQVCNLAWSPSDNELVSSHGYSQNHIILWKYPTMSKLAVLTGHTQRVLYLACSPDGQTIVTGAGDETLRFWKIFNKQRSSSSRTTSSIQTQLR